jgi:hypothetical protein
MGVIYSLVLEVVPLFGIHEVVVQKTWRRLLVEVQRSSPEALRNPSATAAERRALGESIVQYLANGIMNGTNILPDRNRYIDLAIDPNQIAGGSGDITDGDYNCWILNREVTPNVPFEAKPVPKDLIGRVAKSLEEGLRPDDVADHLARDFNADFIRQLTSGDVSKIVEGFFGAFHQGPQFATEVCLAFDRLVASADPIDTALDLLSGPIDSADDILGARAIVSSFFAGLLGIEGRRIEATDAASRVGAIGFPASGIMGTAIEIALAPEDAFTFLQTEILDQLRHPFFGYLSIRVCPRTNALVGMQQFDPSVMIELVAFATETARSFVASVQQRTMDRIQNEGLNAMVHWGLENSLLTGSVLRHIPVLNAGSPSKLEKFRTVRAQIKAAAAAAPSVFDNAVTRRLEL